MLFRSASKPRKGPQDDRTFPSRKRPSPIKRPRVPPRAGIQRSESGPKAKKFPTERSFPQSGKRKWSAGAPPRPSNAPASPSGRNPAERIRPEGEEIPNRAQFSAKRETERCWEFLSWYARGDLNPYPSPEWNLNPSCLPISPRARQNRY